MGQPVAVVEKPSARRGIVRFEANRNLTGMGHERFTSAADAIGPRPAAELARRLFATGAVAGIHIYMNIVTVDLNKGHTPDGLQEIIENLYIYYVPGFVLPTFEEAVPEGSARRRAGGERRRRRPPRCRRRPSGCRRTCWNAVAWPRRRRRPRRAG